MAVLTYHGLLALISPADRAHGGLHARAFADGV